MQLYSKVNSVQSDEKRLITVNVHFVFLHILTVLFVKTFFRSRDQHRDRDKMNSSAHLSLETMVSKSHHWLHQFRLVTEHSLKGATNYGNRATGLGTKHAVWRPRHLVHGSSGLETKTETWTK